MARHIVIISLTVIIIIIIIWNYIIATIISIIFHNTYQNATKYYIII